jgi:plasmid stabilization system protein ParE
MPDTLTTPGADLISAVAAESIAALTAGLEEDFRQMTAAHGRFVVRLGEFERRQAYRDEGATSLEAWSVERFGVSTPTARAYARVSEKAWDIPHLVGALCDGDVSFDKVRAVVDVATPETDHQLSDQARHHNVHDLADIARLIAEHAPTGPAGHSASDHDRRYLRCNDKFRTINIQLAAESYAEARACIDALAATIPSDGETPLDQRRCDGFMGLVRSSTRHGSANPYVVVVHTPLSALVEASETTALAGELERDGLIDCGTVRRIVCDATVAVAVDDDVGHTMYEGRARRFPTDAQRREVMRRDRHCRFAGCTNVTFTNVHHIVPWKPGGRTDLPNLVLLCKHHHDVVHRGDWTMSGNANGELTILGPSGRVMTSRPSPLWTRVTSRKHPRDQV